MEKRMRNLKLVIFFLIGMLISGFAISAWAAEYYTYTYDNVDVIAYIYNYEIPDGQYKIDMYDVSNSSNANIYSGFYGYDYEVAYLFMVETFGLYGFQGNYIGIDTAGMDINPYVQGQINTISQGSTENGFTELGVSVLSICSFVILAAMVVFMFKAGIMTGKSVWRLVTGDHISLK